MSSTQRHTSNATRPSDDQQPLLMGVSHSIPTALSVSLGYALLTSALAITLGHVAVTALAGSELPAYRVKTIAILLVAVTMGLLGETILGRVRGLAALLRGGRN